MGLEAPLVDETRVSVKLCEQAMGARCIYHTAAPLMRPPGRAMSGSRTSVSCAVVSGAGPDASCAGWGVFSESERSSLGEVIAV